MLNLALQNKSLQVAILALLAQSSEGFKISSSFRQEGSRTDLKIEFWYNEESMDSLEALKTYNKASQALTIFEQSVSESLTRTLRGVGSGYVWAIFTQV